MEDNMRPIRVVTALLAAYALFVSCAQKAPAVDTSSLPPPPTGGGTEHLTFHSNLLGKDMGLFVHLPPTYDPQKKYPVVYLFHGFSNDEREWFDYHGLHTRADELLLAGEIDPLILVAVRMDNSWGSDTGESKQLAANPRTSMYSGPYESYFLKEVIPLAESRYAIDPSPKKRGIAGISMGGYSVLHIALRHPRKFGSVAAHSPALLTSFIPSWLLYTKDRSRAKNDPILLASRVRQGTLRVWLDCGDRDSLLVDSEAMRDALLANGWQIEYSVKSGKHEGSYWESRLDEYLRFYSGQSQSPVSAR